MKLLNISRRDFIKATVVAGTAVSVSSLTNTGLTASKAHAAENDGTQIIRTNCRNCTADCGVLAHMKNGRVIKLEGDPEFERSAGALCPKGLSGIQALYNPNRLKYPMERVGARGENKWKRISWDDAIDKIAHKLMEIREKYGAESVFASTGGGGNPNFFTTCRVANVFGTPNWFEPGAAQCYMPRTLMYTLVYGGGFAGGNTSYGDNNNVETFFYEEGKTKSVVLWAAAPSFSGPSQAGRILAELRARGVKTVVVDPRFTPDASKADVWLPLRPGTDVALALSWIRYILVNELYDKDFVMKWTNLPYLVNAETKMFLRESDIKKNGRKDVYVVWDKKTNSAKAIEYPWDDKLSPVLGGSFKVNGAVCKTGFQLLKERAEPWTLEKAAENCWLRKEDIEKAVNIYARNTPGVLGHGVATDQFPNSTQAAHATAILNMLLGNVEKPGAGLQRFDDKEVAGDGGFKVKTSPLVKFLPEKQLRKRLGGMEYKGMLHWWIAKPTSVLDAMETGKPYKLKAWLERSGNKLGTVANAGRWVKALHNLDLIVHAYMYPTSFSAYADYLIPLNEWLETDFIVDSFNRMYARRAVTHLFETGNEMWYYARLIKRLGELGHENCKRAFDPKETAPELPFYDTWEKQLDGWCNAGFGITWKEYVKKAPFEFAAMDEWRRHYVYLQKDPKTGKPAGFNTPSKKAELYLESLITLSRTGQPFSPYVLPPASHDYDPLPFYMEPSESPKSAMAKDFPLVMTNGRLPYWHHLTLRNVPYLREIQPVAEIWVNPADAEKYGVQQSDWVWVESLRGKINAKALLTEGIPKGVVYMERFWNPETLGTKTNGFREMNVNILSKETEPFNEVVGTYTLRGYLVKIYKADGAPAGVWTKAKQFEPWMPKASEPTKIVEL
ncbi:molybdopterin-dependent oxidoreductase [Geovibrio sp. ADMFC3]